MSIPVPTILGLVFILLAVLILPFIFKSIEHNLEIFLLVMGVLSVSVTCLWSRDLLIEAITSPISLKHPIVEVVFLSGLVFRSINKKIGHSINKLVEIFGLKLFIFLLIIVLGLFSSVITAIISSLILAQVISELKLDKKTEIKLVVITCFSIGLGAALTPVGEPLSTIAVAKLSSVPYNAGFFFLFNQLWWLIIPGVMGFGILGIILCDKPIRGKHGLVEDKLENVYDIIVRTLKVYCFIVALVLLGKGFQPIIDTFIVKLNPAILYWINMISAVLDNATLTAAEISPNMSLVQIRAILMGLLISGGMLIPGNIPNIICANKLNITSKEWAKVGLPIGFVAMVVYFVTIFIIL
ncbi:MAG: DUF1646 domain-containing protein [Elusimicrobia bacterium]|nr:DUF1646 domain-containing protein [Elusimicrobiota bacterium]